MDGGSWRFIGGQFDWANLDEENDLKLVSLVEDSGFEVHYIWETLLRNNHGIYLGFPFMDTTSPHKDCTLIIVKCKHRALLIAVTSEISPFISTSLFIFRSLLLTNLYSHIILFKSPVRYQLYDLIALYISVFRARVWVFWLKRKTNCLFPP